MQKVGFRGKKWDQSPFSGVVCKKCADMIFRATGLLYSITGTYIRQHDEAP